MKYKILFSIGFIVAFFIMLRIDSCMDAEMLKDQIKLDALELLETEKPE